MTFLDELRAVRDQVVKHATLEVPVPPGGRHVVRFRPPQDRDKLTAVVAAYRTVGAMSADQERQLIVDCCDEILRRDADTGELVPAEEGGPLRFDAGDERWGDDVKTARDCVAKLYNLDTQPLALAGIADALVDWLQGIDSEIAARIEEAGKAQSNGQP
jgi:hypothetical protein